MTANANSTPPKKRIAYVMSRFPKLTETFIFSEILAMERLGFEIEVYPLKREKASVVHPEVAALVQRANFCSLLSLTVLWSNLIWLLRSPISYLKVWRDALKATWGSRRYFVGAIATIPLASHFARHMKRSRIDHVHAHFVSHPAVAAFVVRRLAGIPFSFTAHGSDLHREHRMLSEKVEECEFAVTISEFNREWMIEKCGEATRSKIHVVHCGVRPNDISPAPHRNSPRPLRLLCVGSLHEVKGQTYLLEACQLLQQRGIEIELSLVGDGPDRADLEQAARRHELDEVVIFHGPQTRQEVMAHMATADIVVTPSVASHDGRREGIPVVLMEAMAASRPVVASRLSGIPELVEDGVSGVLVPPRNSAALADALARLASEDVLRQSLGRRAREKVEQSFDLDREAERLGALFAPAAKENNLNREPRLQEVT